ncbi:AcrR family transcriptional regulator [Actinopolymorpha cephalotaxi]|uniref:AcrR family transcriptional regulator n=2 Tax=Actinopolymorpha cephalotaxi TaxID=504797 RepID=A0ABX2S0G4_9ACTN|nr:AcrR family transcriptional regulator [Actinopolymorpha cephalotaxi]
MTMSEARPRGGRLPRLARRAQLLDAARQVFVAVGYHAAAMDDIADRAGVSKPVLYQHFPSKLELYLALLDATCDGLVDAVRAALASTTDNQQRVAATMRAYLDFVSDEDGTFRLVFESDLTGEPAVRERVDRVAHQCADAIADVIQEDTGGPREQALLLAAGLAGTAQVTARWWLSSEGSIGRDEATRLLTTLAWRGLRGFPRAE